MKYPVKREGRPGVFLVDKETVKKIVKDRRKKTVHNFIQSRNGMLLGADWSLESFNAFVDSEEVTRIGITIPSQMGHAIAIPTDTLYLFDVGEFKEEDFEIEE